MAKVKGCVNDNCVAHKKKITYKESEEFCSRCGQPLAYVCPQCYTPIGNGEKYCVIHQAEKDDRIDKTKKIAAGVGGGVLAVGGFVLTKGKEIVKHLPKIK